MGPANDPLCQCFVDEDRAAFEDDLGRSLSLGLDQRLGLGLGLGLDQRLGLGLGFSGIRQVWRFCSVCI